MLHSDGDYEDISGDGGVLKKRSTDAGKSHTKPTDGVEVGIFYVGTLLNGREFDSNRTFGSGYSKPLNYVIGSGKMVAGEVSVVNVSCDVSPIRQEWTLR